MKRSIFFEALLVGMLGSASVARAEEEEEETSYTYVPGEKAGRGTKPDGVEWQVEAGTNLSVGDNRNVVGQVEGTSVTWGYRAAARVDAREAGHESRNRALATAAVSQTPAIGEIVKIRDELSFETIYLYHILDWFGPFARAAAETAMLRGTDVRAEPRTYQINKLDGTTETVVTERLELTEPFQPGRFKQSLGVFFQPLSWQPLSVEVRAGVGAREVIAANQRALNDDEATEDVIEVDELDDSFQVGGEGVLELWGDVEDQKITYRAFVEVLAPFVQSGGLEDEPYANYITVEAGAALGFQLVDWASVEYELGVRREPLVVEGAQVRNLLLVNFGWAAGNVPEEKPD